MLEKESVWFRNRIGRLSREQLSPTLNFGSGTAQFRARRQSYIETNVLGVIRQNGADIINVDLKEGAGVDICGDIFDVEIRDRARCVGAKMLLCLNILEHVVSPKAFAEICEQIVPSGALILVSVPRSFPYHPDPIDNMFRPSEDDLARLFDECEIVESEIVKCETLREELMRRPARRIAGLLAHLVVPFPSLRHWRGAWSRLRWINTRYEVTCAVLKKR